LGEWQVYRDDPELTCFAVDAQLSPVAYSTAASVQHQQRHA
jgi:hypothetical protein